MKKLFVLLLSFSLISCSTLSIPKYIKDENPYEKILYASFDDALNASSEVLKDMGWEVAEAANPSVFEHSESADPTRKQIILFTEVRQMGVVVGSSYQRLNLILKAINENSTQAEIRYVTVSTASYKTFYSYKKDQYVKQIFERVEEKLK